MNNNFSILPWYTSLGQQNSKKWWAYGKVYPLFTPAGYIMPFQILQEHHAESTISHFYIYTKNNILVGDYISAMLDTGLQIKRFTEYDVVIYPGLAPFTPVFSGGQYYAVLIDSVGHTWYSEIFTVVNNIAPFMKLEWWDIKDFVMDAGIIVYEQPSYKNILYLPSDIAKPEYIFEDEGETRDGYFFPFKQLSEKRYHFNFLASEYLLDVLRFAHISNYMLITSKGQTYKVDTFTFEPSWEGDGDIASVEAEFDTSTVAKQLGAEWLSADFNNDFNNDFDSYIKNIQQ